MPRCPTSCRAPLLTGTLGAVIRIRDAFPTKAILFDIGIAGPIAGFVVTVPALFIGLGLSRLVPLPPDFVGFSLGEPLLFRMAAWMVWGSVPEGYSLSLHPMAFAAWFGLIATALNLIPFGQLDGGHISYAVLDRRSTTLSLVTVVLAIGLVFFSLNWLVWVIIMMVMLFIAGPRHPRVIYEQVPLDAGRRRLAWAAVAMFILCFTPGADRAVPADSAALSRLPASPLEDPSISPHIEGESSVSAGSRARAGRIPARDAN